jgi:hypothetical protein
MRDCNQIVHRVWLEWLQITWVSFASLFNYYFFLVIVIAFYIYLMLFQENFWRSIDISCFCCSIPIIILIDVYFLTSGFYLNLLSESMQNAKLRKNSRSQMLMMLQWIWALQIKELVWIVLICFLISLVFMIAIELLSLMYLWNL